MFARTKSAREWLVKYYKPEYDDLPADVRGRIRRYKIAQAAIGASVVIGVFSYTMWMMGVGLLGFACLLFMRKGYEPVLDRAIERARQTEEILAGAGAGRNPLERAKARYLALPDGDPRMELALQDYKNELAKAQGRAAQDAQAEPASSSPAPAAPPNPAPSLAAAPAKPTAVAKPAPAVSDAALAMAVKTAEAKYLALKDGDPRLQAALQEYVAAKERYDAAKNQP